MFNILADENMPLVEETFGLLGRVTRAPGRQISSDDLKGQDLLLVRSVTKVNEELLRGHNIQFVGTATIGTDHLDMVWMDQQGIPHTSAPGCNADSVAEYVVSCLASLIKTGHLNWSKDLSAGIVGAGNVGRRVTQRMQWLGLDTRQYDPPRAQREPDFHSDELKAIASCPIVCLHAPLTTTGEHPSFHMIGEDFLSSLADGTILISAGRGPVIDFAALEKHMDRLICCLDVWEPEPDLDVVHLQKAHIATPHVAGYSLQSKWRGTTMLYHSFCELKNIPPQSYQMPLEAPHTKITGSHWYDAVLENYDPIVDTQRTREALLEAHQQGGSSEVATRFDLLRKSYPLRHEFNFPIFDAPHLHELDRELLQQLGWRFQNS